MLYLTCDWLACAVDVLQRYSLHTVTHFINLALYSQNAQNVHLCACVGALNSLYGQDFVLYNFFSSCFQPGKIGNPWGPVVDGQLVGINFAFLPDPPLDMRRQSRMKQVKILAGQNLDDGAYFIRKF